MENCVSVQGYVRDSFRRRQTRKLRIQILRPQIFLTFGTTRVVGRQPYAPAAFTPGEIPGTYF